MTSSKQWTVVLAATLAAMPALAVADATALPAGAQLASVEFPLECKFPVVGNQTLRFRLTGSVPSVISVGQGFTINDVSATVLAPQGLIQFIAGVLETKTVNAVVSKLPLTTTGLSPASTNLLSDTLSRNGLVLDPGEPLLVDVPEEGFIDSPRFTARRAGEAAVTIGVPEATIYLKGANGNPTFFPLKLNCKAAQPAARWFGVRVVNDAVTAPDPHAGVRSTALANEPADAQYVLTHTVRRCTFGSLGVRTVDDVTSGVSPRGVAGGDSFWLAQRRGELQLPASLVDELLSLYPGASGMQASLGSLTYTASGATPATLDVAVLQPQLSSVAALAGGSASTLAYPYDAGFMVGPYTAATRGSGIAIGAGPFSGALQFYAASGATVGAAMPLACEAPQSSPVLNSLSRE